MEGAGHDNSSGGSATGGAKRNHMESPVTKQPLQARGPGEGPARCLWRVGKRTGLVRRREVTLAEAASAESLGAVSVAIVGDTEASVTGRLAEQKRQIRR